MTIRRSIIFIMLVWVNSVSFALSPAYVPLPPPEPVEIQLTIFFSQNSGSVSTDNQAMMTLACYRRRMVIKNYGTRAFVDKSERYPYDLALSRLAVVLRSLGDLVTDKEYATAQSRQMDMQERQKFNLFGANPDPARNRRVDLIVFGYKKKIVKLLTVGRIWKKYTLIFPQIKLRQWRWTWLEKA